MTLEGEYLPVLQNPSAHRIRDEIQVLDVKGDGFLILAVNELTYIQVARNRSGFIVEYQQGSVDAHFRACRELDSVAAADLMVRYRDGNSNWSSSSDWEKVRVTRPWWRRWLGGS